jgi:outer membrane murein-binding lipoprotein Lpp
MAAGFSPMPSRGGGQSAPVSSPQGAGSPSSLVSQSTDEPQDQGDTSVDAKVDQFSQQVRKLHTTIDAMARQFPEFAQEARKAQDALMAGIAKVVSKQRSPQQGGAAPPVG